MENRESEREGECFEQIPLLIALKILNLIFIIPLIAVSEIDSESKRISKNVYNGIEKC